MNNVNLVANLFLATVALGTTQPQVKTSSRSPNIATFIASEGRIQRFVALRTKKMGLRSYAATYTVTATVYQAVAGQTDDEPFVTADNSNIKPDYSSKMRWMAISRDLLDRWGGKFQYGDKVYVQGISPQLDGIYTVHDTMNKRHHHCIDILTHPSENFDIFTKGVKIQLEVARPRPLTSPAQDRKRETTASVRPHRSARRASKPLVAYTR